jgi:hypothetical protein
MNDKTKALATWVAYNAVVSYGVFVGMAGGDEGWGRVIGMIAVLSFVMSLAGASDDVIAARRAALVKKPYAVPAMFDFVVDLILAGGMAYYGYPWTSMLYAAHAVFMAGGRAKVEKEDPCSTQ